MYDRGFKSWCEKVSLEQRRRLNLQPYSPLDPWKLGESLGIKIIYIEELKNLDDKYLDILLNKDPDSWSAVTLSLGDKHLIILNSAHSIARQASDLMHEISHIIIAHKSARIDITPDKLLILKTYDKKQEIEADWLSGSLLLPRPALIAIRKRKLSSYDAAKLYGVSHDMLKYRINITGVNFQFNRLYKNRY